MPYRKPGEGGGQVRVMGGRKFVVLPGERLVAHRGSWWLFHVPYDADDGWTNFKAFVDDRKVRKRMWQMGIKGDDVARVKWLEGSMAKHDGLFDWVVTQAKRYERRMCNGR